MEYLAIPRSICMVPGSAILCGKFRLICYSLCLDPVPGT